MRVAAKCVIVLFTLVAVVLCIGVNGVYFDVEDERSEVIAWCGNAKNVENIEDNENEHTEDIYDFQSDSLPRDARGRPSVGNGHLATVVHTDTVHMNGLYNGRLAQSHRAVIPSTINTNIISIDHNNTLKRSYILNTKIGVYKETLVQDQLTVHYRLYAHRTVAPLLVLHIDAIRSSATQSDAVIHLNNSIWSNSPDITFYEARYQNRCTKYRAGYINQPETDSSGKTQIHMIYDVIPDQLIIPAGKVKIRWSFLTSIHVSRSTAIDAYQIGITQLEQNILYKSHVDAWVALWSRGTVELKGDKRLAMMTIGSFYYILSSLPIKEDHHWPFFGLSPNGLAWGKKEVSYYGGVFWDQDTWMYPPILALHSDLAKILISTRKRTMAMAAVNAKNIGYKGFKYPLVSKFTGIEATRASLLARTELHINNDVAFAILQYYWATHDVTLFTRDVYDDIIIEIAEFWISRLTFNKTLGKYVTLDVCGPDEYHNRVNNSIYTNVGVKMVLEAAAKLVKHRKSSLFRESDKLEEEKNKYQYYADRILLPLDSKRGYHPEYDNYVIGTKIKQADVVLLGFPLMYDMTVEQRRSDLEIYENVTSPRGPAMTWSMHAVAWLELNDEKKAFANLKKTFDHVVSPFQVWSEYIDGGGAPSFITGQGGFLQAILFGYGGFRIRPERLNFDFTFPPNVTEMNVRGFDYLGNSLNFVATTEYVNVTITEKTANSTSLDLYGKDQKYHLKKDVTVQIKTHKGYIIGQH